MLDLSLIPQPLFEFAARFPHRVVLVGGSVIDLVAGRQCKDWDIEVYGLSMGEVLTLLSSHGYEADLVGAAFGVLKIQRDTVGGLDVDLSVPRRDNKAGKTHNSIEVFLDGGMTSTEAARRRDFTINSMGIDLKTGEILDPFGGMEDLRNRVLRVTDPETFVEDPLRALRAMQLLARKAEVVDSQTHSLISSMADTFEHLPKERVYEEFRKLLMKAVKPSVGLRLLETTGWLQHFPALCDCKGCLQNPDWHPEGDVWDHSCLVVDKAAALRHLVPVEWQEAFMWSALLHDCGKPVTTTSELTAPGHDMAGMPIAQEFLESLGASNLLTKRVVALVGSHMAPHALWSSDAGPGAWRRLHGRCGFALEILGRLSQADRAGSGLDRDPFYVHPCAQLCFDWAEKLKDGPIKPLVQGRDLQALGMKPGPSFGPILKRAFELQLSNEVLTREQLLEMVGPLG